MFAVEKLARLLLDHGHIDPEIPIPVFTAIRRKVPPPRRPNFDAEPGVMDGHSDPFSRYFQRPTAEALMTPATSD